jgi:predicted phosphodiesterase
MKYALIADVHGNLEALHVVLDDIKKQKCTQAACLGDIVGYSKFRVEPGRQYFIGIGAVGQPRDNNPKAAYVVYDMDEGSIELRRLDYDMAAAQQKAIDAGLL